MVRIVPAIVIALLGFPAAAGAPQQHEESPHKVIAASDIVWKQGPPSLPPGAQFSVLYGDPAKEGPFAMRLKMPKGYAIPPHTHPKPEVVTLLSGTARLGFGASFDSTDVKPMTAGSFVAMEPGTQHFVRVDEETVVQLNSSGPWEFAYVNPTDDPRRR
jgi:quercetin dioxygenase-like cupin family protein